MLTINDLHMKYPLSLREYYFRNYSTDYVIKNFSAQINSGEQILINGKNGTGKTTFFKILAGIVKPIKGQIIIEKKNNSFTETAYVNANERSFFWRLTVIENLKYFSILCKTSFQDEQINKLLDEFNILHLKNKKFMSLSSGEKQKVNICRSILKDPYIYLFDEVTNGLDKKSKINFFKYMQKISELDKKIILWVAHDCTEINSYISSEISSANFLNN
tara:strand:- start:1368 stop:2021 length:654 start_codon:yes stop_codon:yes gene_type:complete